MIRYVVLTGLLWMPLLALSQDSSVGDGEAASPIGYASVQEAYDALNEDAGASKSEHDGWTLFTQKIDGKYILWSFTPVDHPVHPSAVRREVVNRGGEVSITMAVLCYSNPFDCDQLVVQFKQINERITARLAADPG